MARRPETEVNELTRFNLPKLQIQRVADVLGVELEKPAQVKRDKVALLQKGFVFEEHRGLNDNHPVDIHQEAEDDVVVIKRKEILTTIDRELKKGNFIHIRIIDENQRGSDNPVFILARNSDRESGEAYIRNNDDDLKGKLNLEEGNLIGFNNNGESIILSAGMHIDIFSQPVSTTTKLKGFDNQPSQHYKKIHHPKKEVAKKIKTHTKRIHNVEKNRSTKNTRLGGGFRLELEEIDEGLKGSNNPPCFIFKAVIAFDDNSPRRTALNLEKEWLIPRKEITIRVEFDKNTRQLSFPEDQLKKINRPMEEIIRNADAEDIGLLVLNNMISQDNEAIVKWLQAALFVNPEKGVHSIEGVFSIKNNNGDSDEDGTKEAEVLGPKIISFDGVETELDWLDLLSKKRESSHEARDSLYRRFVKYKLSQRVVKTGIMDEVIDEFDPFKKEDKKEPEAKKKEYSAEDQLKIEELRTQLLKEYRNLNAYQDKIASAINNMLDKAPIDDEIKEIIKNHIKLKPRLTFSKSETGPRLLGKFLKTLYRGNPTSENSESEKKSIEVVLESIIKSLKNLGDKIFKKEIPWQLIHNEPDHGDSFEIPKPQCDVWQYEIENNKFIFVSIDGYTLGFWINNKGERVAIKDVNSLKEKRSELEELLDISIVEAMFSYLREGD